MSAEDGIAVVRRNTEEIQGRGWADTENHNQLGDPVKGAAAIVIVATTRHLRYGCAWEATLWRESKQNLPQVATELAAWRSLAKCTDDQQVTATTLPPV
jgi:hypothetical protein